MTRKTIVIGLGALLALPVASAAAQQERREAERRSEQARQELEKARRAMTGFAYAFADDPERPRLGITTESSGMRDTLGLLVSDVTPDGPAAKAGIVEGDRIQAVNGVNLRLSREDAGEDDMEGVATRRLIRTLGRLKAGDEAELRVYSDGAVKTVKVKTVSLDDLQGTRFRTASFGDDDRAALGVGLGSSGSRRDTLGVLIASIADDGPAEKAGLVEGDRIQSINGVDLRVPGVDAGDWAMSSARMRRLTRELEKVKPGDDVELRVYSAGTTKTVRLKAVKASEIQMRHGFFFGDIPGAMAFPRTPRAPMVPKTPSVPSVFKYRLGPGDGSRGTLRILPKVAPLLNAKIGRVVTI